MNVTLATFAGREIEFEVRVGGRSSADVIEAADERRPSKIGVQNHSGGVDSGTQRRAQRLSSCAATAFTRP